jgi:hypothetical protein
MLNQSVNAERKFKLLIMLFLMKKKLQSDQPLLNNKKNLLKTWKPKEKMPLCYGLLIISETILLTMNRPVKKKKIKKKRKKKKKK